MAISGMSVPDGIRGVVELGSVAATSDGEGTGYGTTLTLLQEIRIVLDDDRKLDPQGFPTRRPPTRVDTA